MDLAGKYQVRGDYFFESNGLRGIQEGELEFLEDGRIFGTMVDGNYGVPFPDYQKFVFGLQKHQEGKILLAKVCPATVPFNPTGWIFSPNGNSQNGTKKYSGLWFFYQSFGYADLKGAEEQFRRIPAQDLEQAFFADLNRFENASIEFGRTGNLKFEKI